MPFFQGFLWITNCNIVTHYHPSDKLHLSSDPFFFENIFGSRLCCIDPSIHGFFTLFQVQKCPEWLLSWSTCVFTVLLVVRVHCRQDVVQLRIGSPENFGCEYWRQHRRVRITCELCKNVNTKKEKKYSV